MVNISYGPEIQKSDSGKRHRKRPGERRGSSGKRPEKKPPLMESAPEAPELPSTEEIFEQCSHRVYDEPTILIHKNISAQKTKKVPVAQWLKWLSGVI